MRLGFDLDGTLANLNAALAREAARLFPEVESPALPQSVAPTGDPTQPVNDETAPEGTPDTEARALTSRQQRELWKAVCSQENFWETLDEHEPGILERLFQVVGQRRWEVIFLTSRPETRGDTAQAQSHRWLIAHGFTSPSVFVVHGSRGKIAAALALDVVVDDRPENCLDVTLDSTARPILVWRGDEDKVPGNARQLGIGAVSSIAQCLDILEALDQPDQGSAGMFNRLKRLLGLKPRPSRARDTVSSKPDEADSHDDSLAAPHRGA